MSDNPNQTDSGSDDALIKELQALCQPRSVEEMKRRKAELAQREFEAMKRRLAAEARELAESKERVLAKIRKNRETKEWFDAVG